MIRGKAVKPAVKAYQSESQRFGNKVGKNAVKRGDFDVPVSICRQDAGRLFTPCSAKKITDRLAGGGIALSSCAIGKRFQRTLKRNRLLYRAAVIGRIYRYGHRTVGVFAVPQKIAHSVGDNAARLAGRGDHFASGTHAERINPTFRIVTR